MANKNEKYTEVMLREAIANNVSMAAATRELVGNDANNGMMTHFRRRAQKLNIDMSHFTPHNKGKISPYRKTTDEVLVLLDGSINNRRSRNVLLRAMLEKEIIYQCAMQDCPNPHPQWRGQWLVLEIDHIDGNWRNCTLENLRFICPNCHTQTPHNLRSRTLVFEDLESFNKAMRELTSKTRDRYIKQPDRIKFCECGKRIEPLSQYCQQCVAINRNNPTTAELLARIEKSSTSTVAKELGVTSRSVRKRLENYPETENVITESMLH